MKAIILESPYGSEDPAVVAENVAYAAVATLVLYGAGFAAYASHLHLTSFLDDSIPYHREVGIDIGLTISQALGAQAAFMVDRGWSRGMIAALASHRAKGVRVRAYSVQFVYDGRSWATTLAYLNTLVANKADAPRILRQLGLGIENRPLDVPTGPVYAGRVKS